MHMHMKKKELIRRNRERECGNFGLEGKRGPRKASERASARAREPAATMKNDEEVCIEVIEGDLLLMSIDVNF